LTQPFSPASKIKPSSSLGAKCTAVATDPTTLATGGCYVKGNSVMTPPVFGTFGTMGRNIFRDPGFRNLDFSVFKDFKFHERFGAEFRVEFFNVLNHPNLANPYGGVVGPTSATTPRSPIRSAAGAERQTSSTAIRSSDREALA
jgi:hypothetical protein